MTQLTSGGATFTTSDSLAEAAQEYALALTRLGRTELLDLPGVTGNGESFRVRLLVGLGHQLAATTGVTTARPPQPADAETLSYLRRLIQQCEQHWSTATSAGPLTPDLWEWEWGLL